MIRLSNEIKDREKVIAANFAIEHFIFDDQIIGVGTGTTINIFIQLLSNLIESNELDIVCVPSSLETKIRLIKAGIPTSDILENPELDIYFDGADIVTTDLTLIKGGGAALAMEKVLAHASQQFVVIVDSSKYPIKINQYAVPIEIIPATINAVVKPIFNLGGAFKPRYGNGKIGPVISDNGNLIGDITFRDEYDAQKMEEKLNLIPGVIENGIFYNIADAVVIGNKEGAKLLEKR